MCFFLLSNFSRFYFFLKYFELRHRIGFFFFFRTFHSIVFQWLVFFFFFFFLFFFFSFFLSFFLGYFRPFLFDKVGRVQWRGSSVGSSAEFRARPRPRRVFRNTFFCRCCRKKRPRDGATRLRPTPIIPSNAAGIGKKKTGGIKNADGPCSSSSRDYAIDPE